MSSLNDLYTSTKVLFWLGIAGAYGVAEAVGRAVRHAPPLYRRVKSSLRSKAHDTDFYFLYRESGYIVLPGGIEFISARRERVVALKRLEEVPLRYLWTGEGEVTEELYPESFRIQDLPQGVGEGPQRRIRFEKPIEKGKDIEYTLLLNCKRTGRMPEPFLSSKCPHRVDELLLRVVFPANLLPDKVFYIRRNADDVEVHREQIKERDRLTGEFRKLIKYAEPHEAHMLVWQSNESQQGR
ncbi:MAG TPA: hypothetical protein VGN16_00915 [Acidobacteriaceae bacterium]|jgi:hypothetical protein